MRGALRKLLPFALGLLVGGALAGSVASHLTRSADAERAASPARQSPPPPAPYELPVVRVLSVLTMNETLIIQKTGGRIEEAVVLHPAGSQYAPAEARDHRRGVMQLKFLFGADGRIDEVAPVAKRTDCGACLPVGGSVSWLDPRDPGARDYVEAAVAAVREIKFVPAKVDGRPYPTHGFAECEFRLD